MCAWRPSAQYLHYFFICWIVWNKTVHQHLLLTYCVCCSQHQPSCCQHAQSVAMTYWLHTYRVPSWTFRQPRPVCWHWLMLKWLTASSFVHCYLTSYWFQSEQLHAIRTLQDWKRWLQLWIQCVVSYLYLNEPTDHLIAFSALTLWFGRQKQHVACRNWVRSLNGCFVWHCLLMF